MKRFIFLTLLFLGWSFWVLSGGSDFEPDVRRTAVATRTAQEEPAPVAQPASERQTAASELAAATEAAVAEAAALEPRVVPQTPVIAQAPAALPTVAPAPEPTPAPEPEPEPEPEPSTTADIRYVDASRVNMRSGPGTDYRVVSTLSRDTEVLVLEIDPYGSEPWVKLEVTSSGLQGWMAERFLARQ